MDDRDVDGERPVGRRTLNLAWKVVVLGGASLALGSCDDAPFGILVQNFDFSLRPATVTVVRGDPTPGTLAVEAQIVRPKDSMGGERDPARCVFESPDPLEGVTFTGAFGELYEEYRGELVRTCVTTWTLGVEVGSNAPVGTYTRELVATYEDADFEDYETRTRTLTIEILPDITVDITAPTSGTTVSQGSMTVEATASDAFGDITSVDVVVGSADPVNAFTGTQASVSVSQAISLTPGDNLITVRATNSVGNEWTDTVTVTYLPVTGGIVRWDGGGLDGLWMTAANWDGDELPGEGDAVFIDDVDAQVLYAFDGPTSVRSLENKGTLTVSRGHLTLAEASTIEGALVLDRDLTVATRPQLSLEAALSVTGSLSCTQADVLQGRVDVSPTGSVELNNCLWSELDVENGGDMMVGQQALYFSGATVLNNLSGATLGFDAGGVTCGEFPCAGSIQNQGTVTITGFTTKIDAFVSNLGTIDYGTTGLTLASGENDGTITSAGASLTILGDWLMGGTSSLTAGTLQVAVAYVVFRGSMNVGSIVIQSTLELGVGADVTGLDYAEVQGGTLALGSTVQVEVQNLQLSSGGVVSAESGATLYVQRSLTWMEGTFQGPGETVLSRADITQPAARLTLLGYGPMRLDGHELLLLDPADWMAGDILAGNGAVFWARQVSGSATVVQAFGDNTFDGTALGGTPAHFLNEATVRKVGGDGETTIKACYEEAPGAQLIADTGSITIVQLCP